MESLVGLFIHNFTTAHVLCTELTVSHFSSAKSFNAQAVNVGSMQ